MFDDLYVDAELPEDYDIYDYCGGNYDDAFYNGQEFGGAEGRNEALTLVANRVRHVLALARQEFGDRQIIKYIEENL